MTTIAYRDGVIAADTGVMLGNVRCGHTSKIVRAPDGTIAGASGPLTAVASFLAWVNDGCRGDHPRQQGGDIDALVITTDRRIFAYDNHGLSEFKATPFTAIGSGGGLALAAMSAGASAEVAVQIAIELDAGSFGTVESLKVGDPR